jgi:exodeoxyribonuclease-3
MIRIATWNVNSLRVRLPHVLQWLQTEKPDVLALQETKLQDADFPASTIRDAGYHLTYAGQKTYNGVALLSKQEPGRIITNLPGYDDSQKRVLCAGIGDITVLNLYAPNGSEVGSEKYIYKLDWFAHLHPFVQELLGRSRYTVVLGDLNIAPEDRDVHDPAAWEGSVLVSEPERAEFRKLLASGLKDCFRLFTQEPGGYSWWDYRAASFRRNLGLRIDHILASDALAALCRGCRIDKGPRRLEQPSDHAPVMADFDIR